MTGLRNRILVAGFALSSLLFAAEHKAPPVTPAQTFAAFDRHAEENVTIAAEPYDTPEKISLFRVDYLRFNILPIRLVVTNDSDHPITLRDARILFLPAQGEQINAAEPEDVERRLTQKEKQDRTVALPAPLPPYHIKSKINNKAIEEDFDQFEYAALVVEPHTTHAGFLFYDISGMKNPLAGARLYLKKIRGSNGQDLFYFEIPFDKYLAKKRAAPATP